MKTVNPVQEFRLSYQCRTDFICGYTFSFTQPPARQRPCREVVCPIMAFKSGFCKVRSWETAHFAHSGTDNDQSRACRPSAVRTSRAPWITRTIRTDAFSTRYAMTYE